MALLHYSMEQFQEDNCKVNRQVLAYLPDLDWGPGLSFNYGSWNRVLPLVEHSRCFVWSENMQCNSGQITNKCNKQRTMQENALIQHQSVTFVLMNKFETNERSIFKMNETSILEYSNLIQMKREYLNIRIWNELNEYTWIFEFEKNETSILEYSNLKRIKRVYSNIQILNE